MSALWAAIRFLTILPVPDRWCGDEEAFRRTAPWYPVVGLLLGGLMAASAWGLSTILSPLPTNALLVVWLVVLAGGLHLDGLADTADGMLSWRSRERALEIMKDSHIGTMGVLALICTLLLKVAFASQLVLDPLLLAATWFVAPVMSRSAMLVAMRLLPYARPEGLGSLVWRRSTAHAVGAALLILLVGGLALGLAGVIAGALALAMTVLLCLWYRCRLGGGTGDTLGATCELVELIPFLVIALSLNLGY